MVEFFTKIKQKLIGALAGIKRAVLYLNQRPLLFVLVVAPVLNFLIEVLSRRSLLAAVVHLISRPLIFLCNTLIIMLTLSLGMLFRRRLFTFALVSFLWFGLGVTNFILLGQRTTPLGAIDFKGLTKAISILKFYFSIFEIILMALAVLVVVGGIVLLWLKIPREKKASLHKALIVLPSIGVALAAVIGIGVSSRALDNSFENLADAYDKYGFAYCFSYSLIDTGIDEPDKYDQESVSKLLKKIGYTGEFEKKDGPNIIFLQLESFFDPQRLKGVVYSENPAPFFSELARKYPSGLVRVPSIGAGTANTEFEAISGMSLEYFGPGEYPYKTILTKTASESAPFVIKRQGYSAHAIHNHAGLFYDRKNVFPKLGFDTFTSLEYMQNVGFNDIGWAEDSVLTGEILKTLKSTDNRDFIYTISVQGHGKYSPKEPNKPYPIQTYGILDDNVENAYEYYLSQVREMDNFLAELISELSEFSEPVVLVAYGDHFPKIDLDFDSLEKGDKFQTDMVIWQNFAEPEHFELDLPIYKLYAAIFEMYGLDCGVMGTLHNSGLSGDAYDIALQELSYDMLYGERYIWNGTQLYLPSDMRMGVSDITVERVEQAGDKLLVFGNGFTLWSVICVDGDRLETEFVSPGILSAELKRTSGKIGVFVAQAADGGVVLSETKPMYIEISDLPETK